MINDTSHASRVLLLSRMTIYLSAEMKRKCLIGLDFNWEEAFNIHMHINLM